MSLSTTKKRASPSEDAGIIDPDYTTSLDSKKAAKRQCNVNLAQSLLSPLDGADDDSTSISERRSPSSTLDVLSHAQHVLAVEAAALAAISSLYRTDTSAQNGLLVAVEAILTRQIRSGKVIVTGVGKSGYIAQKLVATCKSLGIAASFMHASEAVHGDLGDVRENDILLLITYSGKTPELINLLPHISSSIPLIALTSHLHPSTCPLFAGRETCILLPAPIPESEESTFGCSAPTTSTTVALAVADMLALTVAEQMHRGRKGNVFKRNHPGGAIGMAGQQGVRTSDLGMLSPDVSGSDDG